MGTGCIGGAAEKLVSGDVFSLVSCSVVDHELLTSQAAPSDEEIVDTLGGHICRCTGYQSIVEAVHLAVEKMRAPK